MVMMLSEFYPFIYKNDPRNNAQSCAESDGNISASSSAGLGFVTW